MLPPLVGSTFLKSPRVTVDELGPNNIAVVGIPYEGTKVSRLGCKNGPTAIREATFMFAYLLQSLAGAAMVDPVTGATIRESTSNDLVDVGDLGMIQPDVYESVAVMRSGLREITRTGAFPIVLGGDHFVTFPSVHGFVEGLKDRGGNHTVGYIQVDAHIDLADSNPFFGKYNSGTQVRRIVDTVGLDPRKMMIIGVGGLQPKAEWDFGKEAGIEFVLRHDIQHAKSIRKLIQDATSRLSDCTEIYVSIDIHIVDKIYAPGVGNVVGAGGLNPDQLIEILTTLRELPLGAVDLVEVAPNFDPSGRTASLAALLLTTLLDNRLFDRSG